MSYFANFDNHDVKAMRETKAIKFIIECESFKYSIIESVKFDLTTKMILRQFIDFPINNF